MTDKYVLDSSIWIEIERKNPVVMEIVNPHIEKNEVCLVDVIVAEVLRGTKTRKDFVKLKNDFSFFNCLTASWTEVADLAFRVSRKGHHPPLIDLYIAHCVRQNRKTLITQDKHFSQIAAVRSFQFQMI